MRCDVYVRYVFKNDTNGGQDVSSVRWILAVSSCLWLECQFVFLRGPYVTQCAEMTRGYVVRGKHACVLRLYGVGTATWICGQRLTSEQTSVFEPLVFVAQGDGVGVTSGVGIARESVLKLNQLTPVLVRSTTLTNTSGVGIARESVLTRRLI